MFYLFLKSYNKSRYGKGRYNVGALTNGSQKIKFKRRKKVYIG